MLGSIIGSVINAGAGLLGSALAPKPDYKAAARDAFKGEFNARMGAAEKYGISKLVMAGVPAAGGHPIPVGNDIGQAVANMGADIGGAVARHMDTTQRQAQQLALDKLAAENELVKAQTRSVNMRTIREATPPRPIGAGLPGWQPIPVPGHRMEKPAQTTMLNMGGTTIFPSPAWSDTANFENRYGETVSDWLVGPLVFGTDMYANAPVGWGYAPARTGGARPDYRTGGSF